MRRRHLLLYGFLTLSGCSHTSTFVKVKSEDTALGRVIVYRNGIAYFERTARVSDQKLTLQVPGDKVNDFLKSLTVVDAQTGQAMPIDFPQPGRADASGNVQMTVRLPQGHHDLRLSYVSEAPAWKPSYRVMVDEQGKVGLQGWAIVDNTSGEDWEAVKVGVGSSSALSFRYDLHSIRMIDRETLAPTQLFAQAPPSGGGLHAQSETVVLAQLDEVPAGNDDGVYKRELEHAAMAPAEPADALHHKEAKKRPADPARTGSKSAGAGGAAGPVAAGHAAGIANLAKTLRDRKATVTIEGYADAGEDLAQGAIRANRLRDELVKSGVAANQINVVSRGVVPGQRGVRVVQGPSNAPTTSAGKAPPAAVADPVGESHFESPVPLSVRRGTSAMVSILNSGTPGEVVYFYDPESPRGDARFAFKAIRFTNPSTSTLEAGPMTVYGKGRFIGEGMADAIPGKSSAVIPFALDRQIVVEQTGSTAERISALSKAVRGVFTAELKRTRKLGYKITNRLTDATTVFVKHVVPAGYKLTGAATTSERFGDAHMFRVALAPGQTKLLEIEEETPVERTLDMRTGEAMDLLRVYLEAPASDKVLAESLQKLLRLHQEIGHHEETIQGLRERAGELRVRMDELHAQIFDLQALRTGGALVTHLKTKMKEISTEVQKNTLAIVDAQEKMTLVKVRLADGLADLSLERKAVAAK
jgi:hypothetical protein